ncbi:MAG: TolC family protein [Microscillaceae bacterium]|nr:TolC family protein [Microscillaceae bacterium]
MREDPLINFIEIPYTFFDQLSDNFRQQVSLSLNIPIFNRWQVRNSINNAQISKRISELTAQNTRNQLRQTIEQAYADAKSALNTYRAREKQVEALQLTYEITEKRYEAGAANIVDFNLAKINVDNARSNLIQAKYDYLFRKKVLDFYLNKPLSFE